MRHCEILLPFGLPPPELAGDLLRQLQAPALAALLGKAGAPAVKTFDPFAPCLPHEAWLANRLQLPPTAESSPPVAASRLFDLSLTVEPGYWFLLHPVHIHIARDHLVLTNRRSLTLTDAESRALFEQALPAFEAAGKQLVYGDAHTWFVRANDWQGLQTASPDAACGHNVDIWMPKGQGERDWRKLQNEVQMEWHENRINQDREARREQPINSLWIWGGAALPAAAGRLTMKQTGNGYASPEGDTFMLLDGLSEPALAEDWGLWLETMQGIDSLGFDSFLSAVTSGNTESITLLLSHGTELREFRIGKSSRWKFWARPSLSRLAP